jgi:AcrR family transcriptional regulator
MVGRPRSFDRDVAVERALEIFWRDGYEKASILRLTKGLGINSPSLYAAFGSKRQLFDEAALLYVRVFRGRLEDCLAAPTARGGIERLLREFAVQRSEPGLPPTCLIFSEALLAGERDRARARVAERIARGRDEGEAIEEGDVPLLATFVDMLMAGMNASALDGATREELFGCVEVAMRVWPLREPAPR